jgi:hypothetical protein
MATLDEYVLKNIGLWWRYGISRHCDEWKYIIIGRIFESEIILIPSSLKISESSSNESYGNTDEVWWRYGISRSCDECDVSIGSINCDPNNVDRGRSIIRVTLIVCDIFRKRMYKLPSSNQSILPYLYS